MVRHINAYSIWPAGSIPADPLTVESVPFGSGRQKPQGRFVGAFGYQGVLGLFKQIRRNYRTDIVLRVDIAVVLSEQPMTVVSERLACSMALHLGFVSRDMESRIRDIFGDKSFRPLSEIILDEPELLNNLWRHPDFKHLKIICWNAPMEDNPKYQMGAIAGPEVVDSVCVLDNPSISAALKF